MFFVYCFAFIYIVVVIRANYACKGLMGLSFSFSNKTLHIFNFYCVCLVLGASHLTFDKIPKQLATGFVAKRA